MAIITPPQPDVVMRGISAVQVEAVSSDARSGIRPGIAITTVIPKAIA